MKIRDVWRSLPAAIVALVAVKERGILNPSRAGIARWLWVLIIIVILGIIALVLYVILFPPVPPPTYG